MTLFGIRKQLQAENEKNEIEKKRDELFRNVKYEDECARIRFAVPMQKAWCPIDILNVRPIVP